MHLFIKKHPINFMHNINIDGAAVVHDCHAKIKL